MSSDKSDTAEVAPEVEAVISVVVATIAKLGRRGPEFWAGLRLELANEIEVLQAIRPAGVAENAKALVQMIDMQIDAR